MVIERLFGVGIFDPTLGGDPVLYQHLFWIYSHPAVYIMILPGLGVISEIIPVFARRTIFGYKFIAFSSLAIALVRLPRLGPPHVHGGHEQHRHVPLLAPHVPRLDPERHQGLQLGGHDVQGIDRAGSRRCSSSCRSSCSSPSAGSPGSMLGALAVNIHVQDTYFVVGHFHYVMFGGTGFGLFAAMHYWFPKMFGRMYNEAGGLRGLGPDDRRIQPALLPVLLPRVPGDAPPVLRLSPGIPDAATSIATVGLVDPGRWASSSWS